MSPTSFNSCRQIDTDLYVWTGTDTQYKINNLRKIFAIFDVPESELVFYLKDEDNSETVAGNRYEIRKNIGNTHFRSSKMLLAKMDFSRM